MPLFLSMRTNSYVNSPTRRSTVESKLQLLPKWSFPKLCKWNIKSYGDIYLQLLVAIVSYMLWHNLFVWLIDIHQVVQVSLGTLGPCSLQAPKCGLSILRQKCLINFNSLNLQASVIDLGKRTMSAQYWCPLERVSQPRLGDDCLQTQCMWDFVWRPYTNACVCIHCCNFYSRIWSNV